MPAAREITTRSPRRRRVVAAGIALGVAAVVVVGSLAATQLGSNGDVVLPPIPSVAGVGAPQNAGSNSVDAGSVDVGTTAYEPPADALYVSPTGDNDGDGSREFPLRTIKAAIARAVAGGTIVLREGDYHESVTIPDGKPLTVQSYPDEAAWLDGSQVAEGWASNGAHWSMPWDVVFDSSPTYTRGAEDNTEEHWNFVTSKHPLAAHPDQLWWDDEPLTQVTGIDELTATSFFHDEAAGLLYLGADPSEHVILASELQRAVSIRAADTVIRGVGVRRYAPSVPDFGAVTVERPRVTLENVVISESATTGLFITAANVTLRNVTSTKNGMIGVAANFADDLVIEGLKASGNNTEWFNRAPVAGGMKLTRSRTVVISGSEFSDNNATGLWFDQSCRDIAITGSELAGNKGHGVFLEISARAVIADNYIAHNDNLGMKINDTSSVEIRNNLVVSKKNAISVLQDQRLKSDESVPGHDERFMDDPVMTWLGTDVTIVGNTLVGSGDRALIWIEDYSRTRSADDFGITVENNLFARATNGDPQTIIAWPMSPGNVTRFSSLDDVTRGADQEHSGLEFRGSEAVERSNGSAAPLPELPSWIATTFVGFPAVAAALG
ncbi:right-handed parallel beta-helix repeat-containing protein [Salinibacterium sp. TMP30]|uniref:right-handed parallel beta-helix repeat-containing protein n=1 Tax=Salinibacterium sp. TMP30 TaxID=3138237 RepID=UPI0031386748